MELFFLGSSDDFEKEIAAGRIQDKDSGFEISILHKTELFKEGKLRAVVEVDGKPVYWNPAEERDPRIKGNKNGGEKGGFRFSPYFHPKGQFLQDVAKLGMIKAIETAHKQVTEGYDLNAYEFEDPRIKELDLFFRTFISEHFEDAGAGPRKLSFMYQLSEIILFLMKEDIFYRARFFELFSNVPKDWELTEEEKENLKTWD